MRLDHNNEQDHYYNPNTGIVLKIETVRLNGHMIRADIDRVAVVAGEMIQWSFYQLGSSAKH